MGGANFPLKNIQMEENSMIEKKIYFVAEGIVDGETVQSEKFNQIVNPDTRETVFDDVFQITESADFEKHKDKEEFVGCILDIATEYFENFGQEISHITLVAVDVDTDIFLWGVSIMDIEEDSFQYGIIDWKKDGRICKFLENSDEVETENKLCNEEKTIMELSREQFVKELAELGEGKTFNVQSDDSGSVHLALYGCKIETSLEEGINGEITIFKPYATMDVAIDFAIVDTITKEDDGYRLEFNNGMPDVVISVVA